MTTGEGRRGTDDSSSLLLVCAAEVAAFFACGPDQ